jgi:hypothetical protein
LRDCVAQRAQGPEHALAAIVVLLVGDAAAQDRAREHDDGERGDGGRGDERRRLRDREQETAGDEREDRRGAAEQGLGALRATGDLVVDHVGVERAVRS